MLLGRFYDQVELHREDKIVFARFLSPHAVISTSRIGGGLRDDVSVLFNHQSCEPAGHGGGHGHGLLHKAHHDPEGYMEDVCREHGIAVKESAQLSTAANMRLIEIREFSFREISVAAAVTGGVEGNAGRAGDPATGYEGRNGWEPVSPGEADEGPGTINTMIFINRPLTRGALVRSVMTATEAKTAALEELNVNSRYSDGRATGTGTDQIGVAALKDPDFPPLTNAGKHCKLGELIARAVKEATKAVLARQNGMNPERQCSVKILLERFFKKGEKHFGIKGTDLAELFAAELEDPDMKETLRLNRLALFYDPLNAAAVMSMVHLKDQFSWGVLPPLLFPEVMSLQAAVLAAAVSGKPHRVEEYRKLLGEIPADSSNRAFTKLVARAFALGFEEKW